jgi:hypothetical protein
MTTYLNHKQVVSLIKTIGHEVTVIVSGEMGCGKTAMQDEFTQDPFFANHNVVKPIECTQLSDGDLSMPDIDREMGVSRNLPNERFGVHKGNQRGVNGSRPVVLCFDEVGKIPQRIVNMIAAPLYERRFGAYTLPEGSVTYGCTNLSGEGLGDNIPAHIINRIMHVFMRKPTQTEWVTDFAIPRKLCPELIAATETFPSVFDSYLDYQPGGKYEGKNLQKDNPWIHNPQDASQEACASPRSLHAAAKLIDAAKRTGIDDDTLGAALEGTVGAAFASELTSFIRFGRDIPSFARVCADPAKCPIPASPVAQMVQVFQFVTQTKTRDEVDAVTEYNARQTHEMQSLLINRVANTSSVLALFATNKRFGLALADNRKFLNL